MISDGVILLRGMEQISRRLASIAIVYVLQHLLLCLN